MKIGNLKNYLKMEVLKIKLENRNFKKLFENGSYGNFGKLKVLKIKLKKRVSKT